MNFNKVVAATLQDASELTCVTPYIGFLGQLNIEVSLNGQDFTSNGALLTSFGVGCSGLCIFLLQLVDNWYKPHVSGLPPTSREMHTATLVESKVYVFGGWKGDYLNDLYSLNFGAPCCASMRIPPRQPLTQVTTPDNYCLQMQ